MTKLSITSGVVSVEDGIKGEAGDFNPRRKARVELHFEVPEGNDHDAHIGGVAGLAQAHLHSILHKTPAPAGSVVQPVQVAEAPAASPAKTARAKAPAPPKDGEKTKAQMVAEMGLPAGDIQSKGTTAPLVEKDELAGTDDSIDDLLGDTAPIPVTDQELGKAAQEKNGSMKGVAGWAPEKIRALVGNFVQVDGKPKPGAKLQEIPAAARPDFLAQLKALK